MKTCDHLSSRDKKKQAGSYFVMRVGLRNNDFWFCGPTLEFCISGWNHMLQPYIECATALSY